MMDSFIDFDKADFIGKSAAIAEREKTADIRLVSLIVDADDVDCNHDEAVFHNGKCVGYVSSGGYAHYCKKSVAMAYIPAELAVAGNQFDIEILGELKPATLQMEPLYDPSGSRMRS